MTKDDLVKHGTHGYTNLPNIILDLPFKPDERVLLTIIAKWDNQPLKPLSSTFLAFAVGVSRAQLIRIKNGLVQQQYIIPKSLGRGKSKTYKLNWDLLKSKERK